MDLIRISIMIEEGN